MDIVRQLEIAGAPEGVCAIASSQTHGRGRLDRTWQSPTGSGFYCSILLRPNLRPEDFQPFSIAAGLALCSALDPENRLGVQLKWPNDVVVRNRKLAGILIHSSMCGPKVSSAIVGIGLNLRIDARRPESAIALEEIAGVSKEIIQRPEALLFPALSIRYTQICTPGGSPIDDWPARLAYLGTRVLVRDAGHEHRGVLSGLDRWGALILETAEGQRTVVAGELTRGPRSITDAFGPE